MRLVWQRGGGYGIIIINDALRGRAKEGKMKNIALKIAGAIFLLAALLHLLRVIFSIEVIVAGFAAPIWLSMFGFIFALALALWMFKTAIKP